MTNRRHFLAATASALVLTTLAARPAFADAPVTLAELQSEFNARSQNEREMFQQMLKYEGLYDGAVDGAWGSGTARGYTQLMERAQYKKHAPHWTFARKMQVYETLSFYMSDAYLN